MKQQQELHYTKISCLDEDQSLQKQELQKIKVGDSENQIHSDLIIPKTEINGGNVVNNNNSNQNNEINNKKSDSTIINIQEFNSSESKYSRKQNTQLWITIFIGIVFQIIFVRSIFDVYIQSWKSIGVTPVESLNPIPLAKRVVMLQLDGARADTFFEYQPSNEESEIGQPRLPFVHDLIKNGKAVFGISHTSVPTESRSCVQTMMGGFYEDMTAILTGWANTGNGYDRLYNYVNAGWFFGPLILQGVFDSKNCPECVKKVFYADTSINYADFQVMKELDDFTFNQLNQLFNDTNQNQFDLDNLNKDKIIIYANFIGTDASGHGLKPSSWQYKEIMRRDGELIEKIVEKIEKFYNYDKSTTFILTSDHGMADNGAHGDENPQNTRTPFVIWGAGIQPAQDANDLIQEKNNDHDDYSKPWNLNTKQRTDIKQKEMTSFISNLLGISIPTNNEGIIPLQFLNATQLYKTNALLQNALQLASSYYMLEEDAIQKQKSFFIPYTYSGIEVKNILENIKQQIKMVENSNTQTASSSAENEKQKQQYQDLQDQIYKVLQNIQNGNQYIMLYQLRPLQVSIGLGYLGFIAYCLITISKYINTSYENEEQNKILKSKQQSYFNNILLIRLITATASIIVLTYLIVTEAKIVYYAYFGFPIFFFYQFFSQLSYLTQSWKYSFVQTILILFGIILAGFSLTYSFYDRNFISYIFIVLGITTFLYNLLIKKIINSIVVQWCVSCLAISIFPLLPAIQKKNDSYYLIGFLLLIAILFTMSFNIFRQQLQNSVKILTVLTVYSGFISLYISYLIKSQQQVHENIFTLNWAVLACLLGCNLVFDLHSQSNYIIRFYSLIVIVANLFLLFGIAHDVIFIAVFAVLLKNWISYEQYSASLEKQSKGQNINEDKNKIIQPSHFMLAFKLILLVNTSFFGTGNMISISSFNISSVDRFIINLREFTMMALILLKLCQPFIAATAAFICICKTTYRQINTIGLFLLSLILVQIMTLFFFFMVKTEGSWQEKGGSVARFVISSFLILSLTMIFSLCLFLFRRCKNINAEIEDDNQNINIKSQNTTVLSQVKD